jgi:hypothetical protein
VFSGVSQSTHEPQEGNAKNYDDEVRSHGPRGAHLYKVNRYLPNLPP